MTDPAGDPPFRDRAQAEAFLQALGALDGAVLPVAPAALALACLERQQVDAAPYHRHLHALAEATAVNAAAARTPHGRLAALTAALFDRHGYAGDAETYDDLQNADLMRVIDRRKGLPVALGILVLHAARAQGWTMSGLAFPGHFLVRLDAGGERLVIDPFHRGRVLDAADLRRLLKSTGGDTAELTPAHYAPVSDRDILLRLQNNLKLRHLREGRVAAALGVIDRMRLVAPADTALLREQGLANARLGNLRAAAASFEHLVALTTDPAQRHDALQMLQRLRSQLQ